MRNRITVVGDDGIKTFRGFRQVERMGNPAVNVALIPFTRKDEHNFATPEDDAAGQFAADIVATLTALGTNATNIGILANVAVTNGDYLRLNLTTPNTSLVSGSASLMPGMRASQTGDVSEMIPSMFSSISSPTKRIDHGGQCRQQRCAAR